MSKPTNKKRLSLYIILSGLLMIGVGKMLSSYYGDKKALT